MPDLTVVARDQRTAQDFIRREGLALSNPQIVTDTAGKLHGMRGTVLVLDRPSLDMEVEIELSMLAQKGVPVINLDSDPLRNAPMDVLAHALAMRFAGLEAGEIGRTEVKVAWPDREFEIAIRLKDAPQEPPEFETAEEALAWLDSQEKVKKRLTKRPMFPT